MNVHYLMLLSLQKWFLCLRMVEVWPQKRNWSPSILWKRTSCHQSSLTSRIRQPSAKKRSATPHSILPKSIGDCLILTTYLWEYQDFISNPSCICWMPFCSFVLLMKYFLWGFTKVNKNLQKLVSGIKDTDATFSKVSTTPLNSLSPVSLITTWVLKLKTSPRNFKKVKWQKKKSKEWGETETCQVCFLLFSLLPTKIWWKFLRWMAMATRRRSSNTVFLITRVNLLSLHYWR